MGYRTVHSGLPLLLFAILLASSFTPMLGSAMQNSGESSDSITFTDVSNISGLSEISPGPLFNWASYGPGTAWGDYDGDGDLDLYVTARHDHQGLEIKSRFTEDTNDSVIQDAISENDSGETFLLENRNGQFVDVSISAGVKLSDSTAIGATWADYDDDGDVDLYISNYGVAHWDESAADTGGEPNIMFANNGDGTFTDVTSLTNLGNPGHSTSGLFADYDHDGDLDVYSLNAGIYDEENFIVRSETNILYRNDGDSDGDGVPEFSDQTTEAGRVSGQDLNSVTDFIPESEEEYSAENSGQLTSPSAPMGANLASGGSAGTGISWAGLWFDYTKDGWPDLFVASDFGISPLYENMKDGTFKLVTDEAGMNIRGTGMGAHSADIDGDGDFDLCQTNFGPNYIWINQDGDYFERFVDTDVSEDDNKKIGVNWHCYFFDYDLDGDFDLFMTSGIINTFVSVQENALYQNDGNGVFTDITVDVGLGGHFKSMGASVADFDGDGDIDILVANGDGPLQLYENNAAQVTANHWLKVKLHGNISNSHGIGQLVEVELSNGTILQQQTYAGSGYLGSSDPTIHFGLGNQDNAAQIRVHWTTGHIQVIENVSADQTISIFEEAPPEIEDYSSGFLIVGALLILVAGLCFVFLKRKATNAVIELEE